jgi:integrase
VKLLILSRDAVYRFFLDLSKELGIEMHPHRLRYTYAVWLAMKNIPPNLLKEFLGHSSVRKTLEVYTQAQKEKVYMTTSHTDKMHAREVFLLDGFLLLALGSTS